MNNVSGIQIGEIWEFLAPSGSLDWMFLALLIGVFGLGIVFAIVARIRTAAKAKGDLPLHGSLEEIEIALESRTVRWSTTLPSILVMIGLLGTFLGLGLAINEASSLSEIRRVSAEIEAQGTGLGSMAGPISGQQNVDESSDTFRKRTERLGQEVHSVSNLVDKLQGVLTNIGFKFRVSVWGLTLSLLLRLIVEALSGAAYRRRLAIGIWERVRVAVISAEDQEREDLNKVLRSISSNIGSFHEFTERTTEAIQVIAMRAESFRQQEEAVAQTVNVLNGAVENLKSMTQTALETRIRLDETARTSFEQVSDIAVRVERVGKTVELSAGEVNRSVSSLSSLVETGARHVADQFAAGFQTAEMSFSRDVGERFGEVVGPALDKVNSFQIQAQGILTELSSTTTNMVKSSASLQKHLEKTIQEPFSQLTESTRVLADLTGGIGATSSGLVGEIGRLNQEVHAVQGSIKSLKEVMQMQAPALSIAPGVPSSYSSLSVAPPPTVANSVEYGMGGGGGHFAGPEPTWRRRDSKAQDDATGGRPERELVASARTPNGHVADRGQSGAKDAPSSFGRVAAFPDDVGSGVRGGVTAWPPIVNTQGPAAQNTRPVQGGVADHHRGSEVPPVRTTRPTGTSDDLLPTNSHATGRQDDPVSAVRSFGRDKGNKAVSPSDSPDTKRNWFDPRRWVGR